MKVKKSFNDADFNYNECPYCGSEDISETKSGGGVEYWETFHCPDCGKKFNYYYEFTHCEMDMEENKNETSTN